MPPKLLPNTKVFKGSSNFCIIDQVLICTSSDECVGDSSS